MLCGPPYLSSVTDVTFLWNQSLFPQKLYAWIVLYFTLS
jgi:hypothetical protein